MKQSGPGGESNGGERMPEANEQNLVARCRRREEATFRGLVDRYSPVVFALASRLVRPPLRAEDVAQQAFLRVHRGLPHFRGESSLVAWIYRIVFDRRL